MLINNSDHARDYINSWKGEPPSRQRRMMAIAIEGLTTRLSLLTTRRSTVYPTAVAEETIRHTREAIETLKAARHGLDIGTNATVRWDKGDGELVAEQVTVIGIPCLDTALQAIRSSSLGSEWVRTAQRPAESWGAGGRKVVRYYNLKSDVGIAEVILP